VNEGLDETGVCTAINDDWDRFRSLKEVSEFTNPKVLPSLVALPREQVNIVMADFFPAEFAVEAKRLNQATVRVEVTINEVVELECHDCLLPFAVNLSDPDYYPEIVFWPKDGSGAGGNIDMDTWALYDNPHPTADPGHMSHWGGPWLETSGTHIRPGWTAYRALTSDTPFVEIEVRIWDQDNNTCPAPLWCGADDISRVNGLNTRQRVPDLQVWIGNIPASRDESAVVTAGPVTVCAPEDWVNGTCDYNLDSSRLTASYRVCQWSALPGTTINQFDACAPTLGNLPPNARIELLGTGDRPCDSGGPLPTYDTCEENGVQFSAIQPYTLADPNYPLLGGLVKEWQWDCNYSGQPEEFTPGRDCRESHVTHELVPPYFNSYEPSGFYFYPPDGPATLTVAHRTVDTHDLISAPVTVEFTVGNSRPFYSGFELVRYPDDPEVTAITHFYDYAADDSPFTCDTWFQWFDLSGNPISNSFVVSGVVDFLGDARDSANRQYTLYECTATTEARIGELRAATHLLTDKDGASPLIGAGAPANNDRLIVDTLAVNNIFDDGRLGSLRRLIEVSPDGGTITFDAALGGSTITLDGTELLVQKALTLDASALPGGITIDAGNASRVLDAQLPSGAVLYVRGMTFTGGMADMGGCVRLNGNGVLAIFQSTFTGCSGTLIGGAIWNEQGLLDIFNSTITGNSAPEAAGIFNMATTRFHNVTLVGNSTRAIRNDATMSLGNSIIALNGAPGSGQIINQGVGSITVGSTNNFLSSNFGVESIFPADGVLIGTTSNPVDPELTLLGDFGGPTRTMIPRATTSPVVDAAQGSSQPSDQRGFARPAVPDQDLGAVERQISDPIDSDGDDLFDPDDNCPTVRNEDQADSDTDGLGDLCEALTNLTDELPGSLRDIIERAATGHVITFDPTASGGSIVITGGELVIGNDLTIDASSLPLGLTLSGNNASRVFDVTTVGNLALNGLTIRDGQADVGGCIQNQGVLDIVDSTVTGCSADLGGGIASISGGSMTMTNSTVSGNDQDSWGAIFINGNATLVHSTISDNHSLDLAHNAVGGIGNFGVLNIENSIVAGNTGGVNPDIRAGGGTINAFGSNLVGNNSSVTAEFPAGPLAGTAAAPLDPLLNALGDYGGPTHTMLPASSSAAIDMAIATASTPAVDQRGFARPGGALYDLGAVERQAGDTDPDSDGDGVPDVFDDYPFGRFTDAGPGYWAYSFIERLAASGITAGCGGGNYCPEDPVTRAQMAVFLLRGINGSGYSPAAANGTVFNDVSQGTFAAAWIEEFASAGITAGCGNNNYCPDTEVTRDQMAVFLLRAKYGSSYSPPPATGIFNDVDFSHWAVHWIEQLAAEGITAGCGGGNYCPEAVVTRDQMAVFLVRTFGL